MSDYAIVPFVDALHRPYVISTFLDSMRATWPWSHVPQPVLEDRLLRELRAPDSRALMAVITEEPDIFCGWTITKPMVNEIVAGYTRRPLRRKWGIGSSLAMAAGINFGEPVGVWFWTYATERMALKHAGYSRLYHKVTNEPDTARKGSHPPRHQPTGHNPQQP